MSVTMESKPQAGEARRQGSLVDRSGDRIAEERDRGRKHARAMDGSAFTLILFDVGEEIRMERLFRGKS